MKYSTQRNNWQMNRISRSRTRLILDQTTVLGGLTIGLFTYIVYHFIYPLVSKGLLW